MTLPLKNMTALNLNEIRSIVSEMKHDFEQTDTAILLCVHFSQKLMKSLVVVSVSCSILQANDYK